MSARKADSRIAIVGAGISGLATARALRDGGRDVVVFDKGRGPAGRTSSRRAEPWNFDHGAQYFTARDPRFRRFVDAWVDQGHVALWDGRIVALTDGEVTPNRGSTERFVGVPAMNAIAKALASEVDVRTPVRVAPLEPRTGGAWSLRSTEGEALGAFEQVVVTLPPAQAAELLVATGSPLAARAAEVEMLPCWAVMVAFEEPFDVPFDGAFCGDSALSWIARDSSKPGRPDGDAWVLHAAPHWTAANMERASDPAWRAEVGDRLLGELARVTGAKLPAVLHRAVHFWRYSIPAAQVDREAGAGIDQPGCLFDEANGLVLAGDAWRGGRVEGAFLSGVAAAGRLLGLAAR